MQPLQICDGFNHELVIKFRAKTSVQAKASLKHDEKETFTQMIVKVLASQKETFSSCNLT
jgi:hypothetical protein